MEPNVDITMQDFLGQAVERELNKRLEKRLSNKDDIRGLNAKAKHSDENIPTRQELFDSVLATWCRNGLTRDIDAQDFVNQPKIRDNYKISYDEMISIINDLGPAVDKVHGHMYDNIGLHTNAGMLIPRIITQIVREAIEPIMVGTSLLRRINHINGETIEFPALGGFTAQDIAPGQEYPERSLEYAGIVTAKVGKSGVKVRIPDETIRYALFDVMALHLRAGARAMARHKETKIFNLINAMGSTIFDNTGGTSLRGTTTGRDRSGAFNYTLTLDDLFTAYADLMNAGFIPDTLIMNPMGWLIFVLNSNLRSFGFQNGGNLWGTWAGAPGMSPRFSPMGPSGGRAASTTQTEMSNATLYGNVPNIFPAPLSIVVSPFVRFSATCQTTDIILCDRNELGFYIEDEPLVTESWDDPARDIRAVKFRERYALALDNEGQAVANIKAVSIAKGYDFDDFIVTRSIGSGTLPTGVTGYTCIS